MNVVTICRDLLTAIGRAYPQSVVFALVNAAKDVESQPQVVAMHVLNKVAAHSARLVEECLMVSEELTRISILSSEEWLCQLNDASRLYFSEGDIVGSVNELVKLHKVRLKGPETFSENSCLQIFSKQIDKAFFWLRKFLSYRACADEANIPYETEEESDVELDYNMRKRRNLKKKISREKHINGM